MAKNLLFLCTLPEYLSIFNNYGGTNTDSMSFPFL